MLTGIVDDLADMDVPTAEAHLTRGWRAMRIELGIALPGDI